MFFCKNFYSAPMNDWFCKAPYLTSEYSVNQSHMKRQDSLEMRDLLLIYSLEFEISEAAVQWIPENSKNGCL